MTGMGTKLHLIADKTGEFPGSSAEINGEGFSGMKFTAKASSQADFDSWVQKIKESSRTLDLPEYNNLAKPSKNNPVTFYASPEKDLYNRIIMKYMAPQMTNSEEKMPIMQGMEH
jgi:cytochrome o ubiquinol oxidase subunit 2